jgi:O-antigen/teichoic acid export membrane protein
MLWQCSSLFQAISLGLNGAAVYFVGQDRYPLHQTASTLLWVALLLGGGGGILMGWLLTQWGRLFLGDFPPALLPLSLVSLPFLFWADVMGHLLLGQERTTAFALQGIVQGAVLVSVQSYGFVWARGQVEVALAGWVLSQAAAALFAITLIGKGTGFKPAINWTFLRDAIRFGRAGYATNWLQFLNYRLDQFLVHTWTGSAALGQYAVAVSLTEALWQLPTSVGAVVFARAARHRGPDHSFSAARICRLTTLATLGLVICVAATAQLIVPLLFGKAYETSLSALYALLPGTVAMVLPKVIGGSLYGQGKPQYVTYGAGLALAAMVAGDLLLIPRYGIVGAAFASSFAYLIFGVFVLAVAHHVLGEPWYRYLVPPLRRAAS